MNGETRKGLELTKEENFVEGRQDIFDLLVRKKSMSAMDTPSPN